jgi:hypothetical protein
MDLDWLLRYSGLLHKGDKFAVSKTNGSLVYILNQVISQQLVKTLDVQPEATGVAAKVTQAARVFSEGDLGASLLGVSQAGIGQVIGKVRICELECAISTRVGAFLAPEQFAPRC